MTTAEVIELTRKIDELKSAGIWAFGVLYAVNLITIAMFGSIMNKIKNNMAIAAEGFEHLKAQKLSQAGKFTELLEYSEFYYKLYPYDSHINWYRGYAYFQLGNYEQALIYLGKAAEINPAYEETVLAFANKIQDESIADTRAH